MAFKGLIEIRSVDGARVTVAYRGEIRIHDLKKPENVDKLKRMASLNHSAALKFLACFPRVLNAEEKEREKLKNGGGVELKKVLEAVKSVVDPKKAAPPAPEPKKGKGK